MRPIKPFALELNDTFEYNRLHYTVTLNTNLNRTVKLNEQNQSYTGTSVDIPYTAVDVVADVPYTVNEIGDSAFADNLLITRVSVPNSVLSIGKSAFQNCSELESINFPEKLGSLGKYAFRSCGNLTSIDIPMTVKEIPDGCFYGASTLSSVTLTEGLETIGNVCFYDCSFSEIVLPKTVKAINMQAFANNENLKEITCYAINPPTLGSGAFAGVDENLKIKVPAKSLELYQRASVWSAFADKFEPIYTEYSIVNTTPESENAANNGYVSVSSKSVAEKNVEVDVHANEGYHLDSLSYTTSVLGTGDASKASIGCPQALKKTYDNSLLCLDKNASLYRITNFIGTGADMDFYWDRTTNKITLKNVININCDTGYGNPIYVCDDYVYYNDYRQRTMDWEQIINIFGGKQSYYDNGVFNFAIKFMIPDESMIPGSDYQYTFTPNQNIDSWPADPIAITKDATSGKYSFSMPESDIVLAAKFAAHSYSEPTYTWNETFTKCTARMECTHEGCDHAVTETVDAIYVTDTPATCTENEKGHCEATFTNPAFAKQSTEANSVEVPNTALGHHFSGEVTYTWNGNKCTASWHCDHDGCTEVESETVTAVYVKDTDATRKSNETGHYEATFTNPNFAKQTTALNSVEIPDTKIKGLSGGAIAGITVGSAAVVGLGAFSLIWFVFKKRSFADLLKLFKKK